MTDNDLYHDEEFLLMNVYFVSLQFLYHLYKAFVILRWSNMWSKVLGISP